jgi:nucleoporin NUP159
MCDIDARDEDTSGSKEDSDVAEEDLEGHGEVKEFLSDEFSDDDESYEERPIVEEPRDEGDEGDEDEEEEEEEGEDDSDSNAEDEGDTDEADRPPKRTGGSPFSLALPGTDEAVILPPAEPTIHLTDSSPPQANVSLPRTESTTPPESPAKQDASATVAAPVPVHAVSPGASSLGFGRPSTKPTRSSPLANVPISGGDSEDDTTEKLPQPPAISSAAQPPTSKSPSPVKVEPPVKESESSTKTPPPFGSLFGAPPAVPKPSPFTLPPATSKPTPALFGFGTPPTTSPSLKPASPAQFAVPRPSPSLSSLPHTTSGKSVQVSTTALGSGSQGQAASPLFPQTAPQAAFFGQPSSPGSFFGQKPPTSLLPGGGLFGQKTGPSSANDSPTGGLHSGPVSPVNVPLPPTPQPSGGLYGGQQKIAGTPALKTPPSFAPFAPTPSATSTLGTAPSNPADTLTHIEDGMQKESVNLIITLAREFEIVSTAALYKDEHNSSLQ